MYSERTRAVILGVLFITATVSAIIGLLLYGPILNNPNYLIQGPTSAGQITGGAFAELILTAAAVGTSITFFPLLRKWDETMALGYVTFRLFEAIIIVVGAISLLAMVTLREAIAGGVVMEASDIQGMGTTLVAIHDWTFILGPNFVFGIGTLLYTSLLYRTGLVPKPLAIWGMVGASAIFLAAVLELFGVIEQVSAMGTVLSLPIATFEMFLASYLIVKGFRAPSMALKPAAVGAA